MRNVEQTGLRRKGRGLPVFTARRRGTRIAYRFEAGRFIRIEDQFSGLQIHPKGCVDVNESLSGENLSVAAVDDVEPPVSVRVGQYLSRLAVDVQVEKDVFIHSVVIVQIVRIHLVRPDRFACFRAACEQRRGPLVIARTLLRIPRPGI